MKMSKYLIQIFVEFDNDNLIKVNDFFLTFKDLIAQSGGDYLAHKIGQIDRILRNGEKVSAEI